MACVFYIGPRNSYGQKEQNPTFWLKLFLMAKGHSSVLTWKDPVTEQAHTLALKSNDFRIWLRFIMSFIVNGIGFHFLLHVLPIQVAGQATIIGVVFRAIGMIYLADLDDSAGSTMTLVQDSDSATAATEEGSMASLYGGTVDNSFDDAKQKIIDDAVESVRTQMETLMRSSGGSSSSSSSGGRVTTKPTRNFFSIPNVLLFSASDNNKSKKKNDGEEETSSLVV
jgi:hypothetical protein